MSGNKILSAYLTSILGVFSGLLTNLWLLKELTTHVSAVDFGLYSYIFQISSYLLILQLGMDFSVSRQIAEYLGKGEHNHANTAFWELKRFNRYGILLVIVAVLGLAQLFQSGIGVDLERTGLATKLVLLVGANQVLVFLQRPFSAALIGGHHQEVVNIVTVLRTVITTLIAFAFLKGGQGVLSTPMAEIGTQLVANGVLIYYCKKKLLWKKEKPKDKHSPIFKQLFHFAFFSTIGGLAWTVEATSDVLLIKHVLKDLSLLSLYVVWWRFPQMFFDLATRFASSAFPVFAAKHGANDGSAGQTFSRVLLVVIFFASLALVGISAWLPSFIWLWFPEPYHFFQPYQLAVGMGVLVALRILGNLFAFFLLSAGNTRITTRVAWLQALLKVLLAYWAIVQWSLVGLIVASCIAASLQSLFYGFYLLKHKFLTYSQVGFITGVMFCSAGVVWLLPAMPLNLSLSALIGGAVVTAILWLCIFLLMAMLSKSHKSLVMNQLEHLRKKVLLRQ